VRTIDTLADYIADIETNTRPIDNPARKTANTLVKTRASELADAERSGSSLGRCAHSRRPAADVLHRSRSLLDACRWRAAEGAVESISAGQAPR
jgi:hypothetical protein